MSSTGLIVKWPSRILGWALLLTLSAGAVIPPDILLQRGRASHALDEQQRQSARTLADDASITATPEEFQRTLGARSLAFTLYSAVAHVERREVTLQAYSTRRQRTVQAEQLLREYIERCQARLRSDDRADAYSITVWPGPPEDDKPPFQFEMGESYLHVYHYLPWPEHLERSLAQRALAAAEADLQRCAADQTQVENARKEYERAQTVWLRWVQKLSLEVARRSEAALKAEKPPQSP